MFGGIEDRTWSAMLFVIVFCLVPLIKIPSMIPEKGKLGNAQISLSEGMFVLITGFAEMNGNRGEKTSIMDTA